MVKNKKNPKERTGGSQEPFGSYAKVVFPGSFDPLTNGHVDIVERTLTIFDQVVIAVLENPAKSGLFSAEERVQLIRKQFSSFGKRVEVNSFSGLLVDFVRDHDCRVVIRGLRAISDYDYEAQMALINRKLSGSRKVETFFLMTREENSYVSSTVVKQVARFGGELGHMVPPVVEKALRKRHADRYK